MNRHFKTAGVVVTMLLASFINGQEFLKHYPTIYDRTARDIMRTPSGEYLIVGSSNKPDPNDADLYVMRTSSDGTFLWDTTYGGDRPDYAYHMCLMDDNNYLVVGYTQSFGAGDYDMYLLKIDAQGKKIKDAFVNFSGKNDEARQVVATGDGNYLVIGSSGISSSSAKSEIILLKVDGNLGIVGTAMPYGGSNHDYGLAIVKTPHDGGYLIGGQTLSEGSGRGDAYVIKLNSSLATQWTKSYGGALDEEVVGIVANSDGTAMLAIRDSLAGTALDGNINVALQKIDMNNSGAVVSGASGSYGGEDKDTPKTIMPVNGGGYIVGAISRSWWEDAPQMWLIKTDGNGVVQWNYFYGEVTEHDHCHMVKEDHDGRFIAVGHQRQGAVMKLAFLRVSAGGTIGVDEHQLAELGFGLYPNPSANGNVNMKFAEGGRYQVLVTDLVGHEIYSNVVDVRQPGDVQVNIPRVNAGIYIVNVKGEKKSASVKLIIE